MNRRDPRVEKLRNFRRHTGCGPRCGICHPEKRWPALKRRSRRLMRQALRQGEEPT